MIMTIINIHNKIIIIIIVIIVDWLLMISGNHNYNTLFV